MTSAVARALNKKITYVPRGTKRPIVIIKNSRLLAEFRIAGRCEWCGRWCVKREPHHLRTRTPELTIRINLFSVGSTPFFCCSCHTDIGNGLIDRKEVLQLVAVREHCTTGEITMVMDLFRRLIRPTPSELQAGLEGLEPSARMLAERSLAEKKRR